MSAREYRDGRRYTCPWCHKESVTLRGGVLVTHGRPGDPDRDNCAGSEQHPGSYDGPRRPGWRKRPDLDSPTAAAVLREFYVVARAVRGFHPVDHPARKTSENLSELLADLYGYGYSCESLDAAMGARPGTARKRMARHGYLKLAPSMAASRYKGVQTAPSVSRGTVTG